MQNTSIGIIGAGGWGTALASVLAENGYTPLLWTNTQAVADEINSVHMNSTFLPGASIPHAVKATHDPRQLDAANTILITVPTQYIRTVLTEHQFQLKNRLVISGSKGVERGTLLTVSGILADAAGVDASHFAVLTGPSHAEEVARRVPTTVIAASAKREVAAHVQHLFSTPFFRVYSSQDVVGAEMGGALKNVIAIAAGIIDGLRMGDNTKAALITRGLAEMMRLGTAMGADQRTFSGLSGLGDLFVTCASRHSRNRHVGEEIGRGKKIDQIIAEMAMVAEGVATAESAWQLSTKHSVEMPIVEQVYSILFQDKDPVKAINDLMIRQKRPEHW